MVLLLLLALLAPPVSEQSSYITWTFKTDQPAKSGQASSEAEAIARALGSFVAIEFDKKFPCGGSTTLADIEQQYGHQRMRDLLGAADSPETMAAIAASQGARNSVNLTITQTGSTVKVDAVVVDSASRKVTAQKSSTYSVSASLLDQLEAFAESLVAGLAGTIPRCNGKGWAGLVRVSYEAKGSNDKISEEGSGTLSCRLFGDEGNARCSYNSSHVLKGSGGAITTTKSAKNVETSASASVTGGRLSINIGSIPVMRKMTAPMGIDIPPTEENLAGEQFDLPASPSQTSQSGEFSPESLGNMKVTISWSLTKPAQGKR